MFFISELYFIFCRALFNPVGVRMNLTAVESAAYSRFREIASCTSATSIGERIARAIAMTRNIQFLLSFELPEPNHRLRRNICETIEISPTSTAVSVMNLMS